MHTLWCSIQSCASETLLNSKKPNPLETPRRYTSHVKDDTAINLLISLSKLAFWCYSSLMEYTNNSLNLAWKLKYAGIFVCGQYLFREVNSFPKTVSFEEQIMSKDKYLRIFLPKMEAVVFIILQTFFTTRTVLKIGESPRTFPGFRWGIFGHVTRLGQSCASENIWIIK